MKRIFQAKASLSRANNCNLYFVFGNKSSQFTIQGNDAETLSAKITDRPSSFYFTKKLFCWFGKIE